MLAAIKATMAWRVARGLKRGLLDTRVDEPLPAEACRSAVTWLDLPAALEGASSFSAHLRLDNRSGVAWATAGRVPVRLRCRWLTYRGDPFDDGTLVPLPRPVFPGEPQTVTVGLQAPGYVGDFVLEADLVQHGRGAFADLNSHAESARVMVPVVGRRDTDIDYHAVFRTADLDANHWWVVGAYRSKEEYEKSSRDRLGMLEKHGLTPDSRVLDIGCGTGQMAGPLLSYLTDRGAYYGTDIGKEAIDFCGRTFRRRNFVFRQGAMTRVPFDAADGPFDLAIFFSVFTHTFVDESALLLAEAKRLLAPGGIVIADVITSPLVERGSGHRGEMVVNRDHFLRLAGMLGFAGEVIGRWEWNRHAERLMILFRRVE
jgi:SAM-dependent methyltransferase